ncbi:MAG: biopolymer transporter ExbD [Kiritimatiellia bacterium]
MKALCQEKERQGLRIAPLIDIVFLLIIFFLAATTFYEEEKDITINLAEAAQGSDRASSNRIIIVNVRESGVIVVNQRIKTDDQLTEFLREAQNRNSEVVVVVRCDRRTYHKHFVKILDLCEKVGISAVAVATFQQTE